jgi:hypothetical protein
MNQYLVFAGETYYPCGGFKDFISSHTTLEDAQIARAKAHKPQGWSHIVDLTTLKIIESKYENNPIEHP